MVGVCDTLKEAP